MRLAVAVGVGMALVWALGAILIGISSPSRWGGGIAVSLICGMALGGFISVAARWIRTR